VPRLSQFFPAGPSLGTPGEAGLFGPDSAAWRIGRERLLLAGGPAALLLQVAHPLVGAGVAEHSDFTADPLRRLRGTLDATMTVTFGDHAQVERSVAAVAHRHRPVVGRLAADTRAIAAGTPYRADDPDLALWVFATLVWTAVRVHETFLGPVPPAERDACYADMHEFGRLFGADEATMPARFSGLDAYLHRMAAEVLDVGPVARRLAEQILAPQPPLVPAPLRPLPAVLAAGLLPPVVREAFGLPWRRRERLLFRSMALSTRAVVPVLPAPVRYWPHYRTARRRVRALGRPT
jgi:uncharacterized protein (DUF2236 family)